MLESGSDLRSPGDAGKTDLPTEVKRHATWLESRAVQNAIFTSAKFSVMVTDEKGMIQSFNAGAERILGYASAEVVDKFHVVDFHDPEEVLARTRALSLECPTAIASGFETLVCKASRGIADDRELAYLRKDGSRIPASVSISALRDDHGTIIGYLFLGADDPVRQQLELKLSEVSSDAQNAGAATATRLSNLCHELRTPLNVILGFAQLMASGLPSPASSQKRNIDLILAAGWRQQKLIGDVLDLALIESGKLSYSPEPLSLGEILLECRLMTEPHAQTRGVNLVFPTIETSSHFVRADRIRVQQVLISLLSEAINSSGTGGAVIVDCDTRNPDCIRFRIQDSGGSSADPRAQLFQPFDLEANDATGAPGGGVGMILTKRLVEMMGGVIGVGSSGRDRIWWFELERIVHPPITGSPLTAPSFVQSAKPAAGPVRKILQVNEQMT